MGYSLLRQQEENSFDITLKDATQPFINIVDFFYNIFQQLNALTIYLLNTRNLNESTGKETVPIEKI